jgi:uncharacterized protein with GYD domain
MDEQKSYPVTPAVIEQRREAAMIHGARSETRILYAARAQKRRILRRMHCRAGDLDATAIESVGGKLHGFWYAFGEHDGYNLWEAPDNVSMAAVALAISGGGGLSSFETTVLMTVDETLDALRKAAEVQYQAPGA